MPRAGGGRRGGENWLDVFFKKELTEFDDGFDEVCESYREILECRWGFWPEQLKGWNGR